MTCKDCIHNDVCRGVYLAIQDNTKLTLKEFQILCEKEDFDNQDIALYDCLFFQDRSRFVELPCERGDLVYFIKARHVMADIVSKFTIDKCGVMLQRVNGYNLGYTDQLGKRIFLTHEEAEQALKEREENEPIFKNLGEISEQD